MNGLTKHGISMQCNTIQKIKGTKYVYNFGYISKALCEWNKMVLKSYILYDCIHILIFLKDQTPMIDNKYSSWQELSLVMPMTIKENMGEFWGDDRTFLYHLLMLTHVYICTEFHRTYGKQFLR